MVVNFLECIHIWISDDVEPYLLDGVLLLVNLIQGLVNFSKASLANLGDVNKPLVESPCVQHVEEA